MNIIVLVVVSLWKKSSSELAWILLSLLLVVSERNSLLSWIEYYCSCCCQSLRETLCWISMNITVVVVVSLWKKLSVELTWILLSLLLSVSVRNSLLSKHEYYCLCSCRSLREILCWVGMNITVLAVVGLWEKLPAELAWILLFLLLSVSERNSLLSWHEYYCSCCCQSLRETLCWVGINITVLVVVGLWEKCSAVGMDITVFVVVGLWEKLSAELPWILLSLLLLVSEKNSLLSWHEYYCSCCCQSLRETLCWVSMNITVLVVVGLWGKLSSELALILLFLLLSVSERNSLLSVSFWEKLSAELAWILLSLLLLSFPERNSLLSWHEYYCPFCCLWEKLSAELAWILLSFLSSVSERNSLLSWHEYYCPCEKLSAELAWILLSLLLSVSERNSLLN